MSVKERLTAIADKIREHLVTEDKYNLDEMPQAIDDVYDLGDSNGFANGLFAGYENGYNDGEAKAKEELNAQYSMSLSEALTSGYLNTADLETNVNQAKADITAIKTLIENHGVEVPVGTLSSTYDETLEQIFENEAEQVLELGIEQGKQAQYDEFWDIFQVNGTRRDCSYLFTGNGWCKSNLKPKYPIKPTNASNMFSQCAIGRTGDEKVDLREIGVEIDFSNCSNFNSMLSYAYGVVAIGEIKNYNNYVQNQVFYEAQNLHTIELYDVGYINCTFSNTFYNCRALKNITIAGSIGNSIDFRYSPLSKASITSIVEHLSSTTTGKTLTLKKRAVETEFERIYAASYTWDVEFGEDWEPIVWANGIGDAVEVGEYVYISGTDTNIVIQKTGDSIEPSGTNEGAWTLIAQGADVTNEWGDLIASKSNWTISLV